MLLFDSMSLKVLHLEHNRIEELPFEIESLKTLVKIDISTNVLKSLPKSMVTIRKLQRINCANNEIISVPPEMGFLKTLKEFNLRYFSIQKWWIEWRLGRIISTPFTKPKRRKDFPDFWPFSEKSTNVNDWLKSSAFVRSGIRCLHFNGSIETVFVRLVRISNIVAKPIRSKSNKTKTKF